MTLPFQVTRAYAAAAAQRGPRAQEAEVFRRVVGVLRRARTGSSLDATRALADAERLWTAVIDLCRDPENALPAPLRASLVSIGRCVQREVRQPAPDFEFLIAVTDDVAAGLAGA